MIVHASIVPHSPALLPLIGKGHCTQLAKTLAGLLRVNESLKKCKPDTIVVLAPHAESKETGHLSLHVPERYFARFEQFGDMATRDEYAPDAVTASNLKQGLTEASIEAAYTSEDQLEYSAGVPLHFLTPGASVKILVLHPGETGPLSEQSVIGTAMRRVFQQSQKRIAIVASGDLSHCLTESAPGGYQPLALQFDKDLVGILKAQRHKKILKTDMTLVRQFSVCGIRAFTILLHLLHNMPHSQKFYSYEHPLGVGHVVMEFTM